MDILKGNAHPQRRKVPPLIREVITLGNIPSQYTGKFSCQVLRCKVKPLDVRTIPRCEAAHTPRALKTEH
jgi:hypothetical protein